MGASAMGSPPDGVGAPVAEAVDIANDATPARRISPGEVPQMNNPIVLAMLAHEHQEQLRREADAYRRARGDRFDADGLDATQEPRRGLVRTFAIVLTLVVAVIAARGAGLPPVS